MFQVREFDIQDLYGNISGYIGFFLGYSLFQIPSFARFVLCLLKSVFQRRTKRPSNVEYKGKSFDTEKMSIKDIDQQNYEEKLKNFNTELHRLSLNIQELQDYTRKQFKNNAICSLSCAWRPFLQLKQVVTFTLKKLFERM